MKSPIRKMFDDISRHYDFLNHTLSGFQDILWRKKSCKELKRILSEQNASRADLLDLCGGTGDFIRTFEKTVKIPGVRILGDFSFLMLKESRHKNIQAEVLQLDAMNMPFESAAFDIILNGFGLRNLPDPKEALLESHRILKPGGYILFLDFFAPRNFFNKFFYRTLAPLFIPVLGSFFSGKRSAYEYLISSVLKFLPVKDFISLANSCGFDLVFSKSCTFGIAYRILLKKR